MRGLLISTLFLFFAAKPLYAENVTVDCSGASYGPFIHHSIGAALAWLQAISNRNHQITVSGTCTELLFIKDFENLVIKAGASGATILDPGASGSSSLTMVVNINLSKNVHLVDLTIRGLGSGQGRGLVGAFDSVVNVERCLLELGRSGLNTGQAHVRVRGSTIQNNVEGGVEAQSGSLVEIGSSGTQASVIQGNGTGIVLRSGAVNIGDAGIIRNNRGNGILAAWGGDVLFAGSLENKVLDNGSAGIRLQVGSTLRMASPALIQGNRSSGIALQTGTSAWLNGGQIIRLNGSNGEFDGGIFAAAGTALALSGVQIVDNLGRGLILRSSSAATLFGNSTISGNSGEGVRVSQLSTVRTSSTDAITGNRGFDLFCSPDSIGTGSAAGVRKMFCPAFDHDPSPFPEPNEP